MHVILEGIIIWMFLVIFNVSLLCFWNFILLCYSHREGEKGVRGRIVLWSEGQTCFAVRGHSPQITDKQCTKLLSSSFANTAVI